MAGDLGRSWQIQWQIQWQSQADLGMLSGRRGDGDPDAGPVAHLAGATAGLGHRTPVLRNLPMGQRRWRAQISNEEMRQYTEYSSQSCAGDRLPQT